jgi:hypothetical protein
MPTRPHARKPRSATWRLNVAGSDTSNETDVHRTIPTVGGTVQIDVVQRTSSTKSPYATCLDRYLAMHDPSMSMVDACGPPTLQS